MIYNEMKINKLIQLFKVLKQSSHTPYSLVAGFSPQSIQVKGAFSEIHL